MYHAVGKVELDEKNVPKLETIRLPDFSCNWWRFSRPSDIWFRQNSSPNDGCYKFPVKASRCKEWATPVHDPLPDRPANYSHIEIRVLREGEKVIEEPPQDRQAKERMPIKVELSLEPRRP